MTQSPLNLVVLLFRVEPVRESKEIVNLRFGTAVKRFRNQLGISQEKLAERAGLDRTYICHVERGGRNVSLSTIDKLARALEVSIATLLSPAGQAGIQAGDLAGQPSIKAFGDILLVEDKRRDAELTQRAFNKAGFTNPLHIVTDGEVALDFLFCEGSYAKRKGDPPPQVVLLDLNLPKVGGMEVLRRIKGDERTRMVHVVVLTASKSDAHIEESMKLGAAAYIVKPVDFHNFCEVTPKLSFRWALLPAAPQEARS